MKTIVNRFGAIILIFILCLGFADLSSYRPLAGKVKTAIENQWPVKETIEKHYQELIKSDKGGTNDNLWSKTYLSYMKITNRRHINGVTFLTDGRLMINEFKPNLFLNERAEAIIALKKYLDTKNTPFLYVRAPSKLKDNSQLPLAYRDNDIIKNGDELMQKLADNGITTYDLRKEMINEKIDFTNAFFRGDHHWKAETALWAYGKVGRLLNHAYDFGLDEKTWNPLEYDTKIFYSVLHGSESYNVGHLGYFEDLTALYPKFPTSFEITEKKREPDADTIELASGDFVDAFMATMKSGDFSDLAFAHLNEWGLGFRQIKNLMPNNDKRILIITDSFGFPFVTYFATAAMYVDSLQVRNLALYQVLAWEEYDFVIFLLSDVVVSEGREEVFEDDRLYLG